MPNAREIGIGKIVKQGALFLLISTLLAACSQGPQSLSPDDISPATPDPALPLPPEPNRPTFTDVIEEPTGLKIDPAVLLDETPGGIQALFGVPGLVRRDGGVQVMLYDQGPCILDITFLSAQVGDGFAARHIAARDHTGEEVDAGTCLSALLDNRPLTTEQRARLVPVVPSPAEEAG